MRSRWKTAAIGCTATLAWLSSLILGPNLLRGDEPGSRLGRLFRLGIPGASRGEDSSEPRVATSPPRVVHSDPNAGRLGSDPGPTVGAGPGSGSGVGGPSLPVSGGMPRILPQPRVSRAVTESDPIVSRITLGRADGGNTFGLFMHVHADGTILDNEGVHQVGREGIRGVLEAMESSDLFRTRGHCGGPPTDYVEQVHVVVYERSLGRLRANSFSFSGNTQGCEHAVRRLQTALDQLQARLNAPTGTIAGHGAASPIPSTTTPIPASVPTSPTAAIAPPPPLVVPASPPIIMPPTTTPASSAMTPPPLTPPTTIRLNEGAQSP